MHEVLVNRLGRLSLPRKSVVRLTDRPDMTLDVYRGRKTTTQQQQQHSALSINGTIFGETSRFNLNYCQDGYVEHKYLSIRYIEVCLEKNYKIKKQSYLDGKIVFTYILGFIVVIFNFLKGGGGGGGGGEGGGSD